MIKMVQCIHAKPGLPPQEFRRRWQEYGHLLREVLERVGAVELELTTTLAVQANAELMISRSTGKPFDAMAEIWWPSAQALDQALAVPEAQEAVEAVQCLQEEFMDLSRSVFFFAYQEPEED